MEETLTGMDEGWAVHNPCLTNPQSLTLDSCDEILESLELNLSLNLGQYSCFMFYYSGHGTSEGLLLSDGSCKPYDEIVMGISKIFSLIDRPKIFIFDCCRVYEEKEKNPEEKCMYVAFNKAIEKTYNRVKEEREEYPPRHTVISFSACEGMSGYANQDSFYTRSLSTKLKQFGKKLSFSEILVLANGGATRYAQYHKVEQRPVIYCTLEKLLLLSCEFVYFKSHVALRLWISVLSIGHCTRPSNNIVTHPVLLMMIDFAVAGNF